MPAVKLTLRLDQDIIELGKSYARQKGTSLSKLVEQFLREETSDVKQPFLVVEPDPDLAALMLKGNKYDERDVTNYSKEFSEHYADKHLKEEE